MSADALDFQLLFEESPDVLIALLPDSPRFTVVAATRARLAATHSTREETIGRGLFELFPDNPDDPEAQATANLRASLERVLATKSPDTMAVQKYDIPLPGGGFEAKYWSPRNIPVLSPSGDVLYILHRAIDVTDLVRATEEGAELRGRTQDMEREVVRRSRELDAANRQLRAANQKMSESDAAKTAFFSNISHEFRTPLTLMLGPLEDCIADSSIPNGVRMKVELAHHNALRLLKLVNSLLDFARLEPGRLRGRFVPTDLAALTRDLAGMFQSAFDKAGVKLTLDCPSGSPVYVDKDMWEKIIPNLVSNAFKFTLSGEVAVRVRETSTHATIQVIDSGSGIPESELPHIFDRFHRVTGAVGRTHEGAGIGLALVRELVELHGGTVAVESTLGQGSEFRVSIPLGFAHLPADAVAHSAATPASPAAAAAYAAEAARWDQPRAAAAPVSDFPDRAHVLVVDDNADLRSYMSGLLQPLYRVDTANDGQEALERIRLDRPDLVLSDVMMPRMTGIELAKRLRDDAETINLPVILLSARAGDEAMIEGLDAGSDDYLTKPFTAQELMARVRSHLKLSEARSQWAAELESANRELDAFSYSVAHDLRAPLRAIDGFSAFLLEDEGQRLSDSSRRHLDIVRRSAQRMSQMIDDLLRLAKIGRGDIHRVRFDLSALAHEVVSHLRNSDPARKVALHIEGGIGVDADPALVRIVLENLLGNAWKFTAKRADANIEFGARTEEAETIYFVRDNGAGFDMAFAPKLFGVFQRLHTEAEFAGTGVGLATVKRIVGRHEGRIWAESEIGRGAAFYFTLHASHESRRPAA